MKKISLFVVILIFGFTVFSAPTADAAKKEKKAPDKKTLEVRQKPPEKEPSDAAPPDYPDPAMAEIHQELADIIRVHQSLQLQYRDQVREIHEIQRITDQARAHQKLLKDLETVRRAQEANRTMKTLDELVRIEKIRLIQEQTRQNRVRLGEIQKQES